MNSSLKIEKREEKNPDFMGLFTRMIANLLVKHRSTHEDQTYQCFIGLATRKVKQC